MAYAFQCPGQPDIGFALANTGIGEAVGINDTGKPVTGLISGRKGLICNRMPEGSKFTKAWKNKPATRMIRPAHTGNVEHDQA